MKNKILSILAAGSLLIPNAFSVKAMDPEPNGATVRLNIKDSEARKRRFLELANAYLDTYEQHISLALDYREHEDDPDIMRKLKQQWISNGWAYSLWDKYINENTPPLLYYRKPLPTDFRDIITKNELRIDKIKNMPNFDSEQFSEQFLDVISFIIIDEVIEIVCNEYADESIMKGITTEQLINDIKSKFLFSADGTHINYADKRLFFFELPMYCISNKSKAQLLKRFYDLLLIDNNKLLEAISDHDGLQGGLCQDTLASDLDAAWSYQGEEDENIVKKVVKFWPCN